MSNNTNTNAENGNAVNNASTEENSTMAFKVEGDFPMERIEVEQTAFAAQLRSAVAIIPLKPVLPVQSNVMLTIKEDIMTIDASSSEQSMTMKVPIANENGWNAAFTLPAKKLNQIVSGLVNGRVVLYCADGKVILKQGKATFKLNYDESLNDSFELAANDAGMAGASTLMLSDNANIATLLAKVALCQSIDIDRTAMRGVNVSTKGSKVTLSATDGRRACLSDFTKDDNGRKEHSVTIPTQTVTRLQNLLKERTEGGCMMRITDKAVHFVFTDCTLRTKLIEAPFPNVQKIVQDKDALCEVMVDRESLLANMRQVRLVSPSLHMFFGGDGVIKISANAEDNASDAVTEVETASEIGELAMSDFSFNSDYLFPYLEKCEDEQVELRFAAPEENNGEKRVFHLQAYDGNSVFLMMGMKG